MDMIDAIILLGTMVSLAAIPSTSVALVVTRSATLGTRHGVAVAVGVVLGDLVFIALAILGLTVVAELLGHFFMVIKMLGGLYLIWLGYALLSAKHAIITSTGQSNSKGSLIASALSGLLLTLGDIKAIFFYASLFPLFIDLAVITVPEVITIMLITILGVGGVKVVYAIFATKLAAYARRRKMDNVARKTAGGFMIGAGSYLLVKS